MFRTWFAAVACCAAVAARTVAGDAWDSRTDAIMAKLTTDDILGQMTQINIDNLLKGDKTLDEEKVIAYAKLRIGSYLNSPFSGGPTNGKYGWTATEWRA
ncbi:hypothetical protein PybrP1_007380, partial [[Pythium] brassicae (nom. inval.)]